MKLAFVVLLLTFSCNNPKVVSSKDLSPARAAVLTWDASDQKVNYRVHRSAVSGGPYRQIADGIQVLTYKDTTVVSGKTYYYVVDCRNPKTNLISTFSNEVKEVVP